MDTANDKNGKKITIGCKVSHPSIDKFDYGRVTGISFSFDDPILTIHTMKGVSSVGASSVEVIG